MKSTDETTLQFHLDSRAAHVVRDLSWVAMPIVQGEVGKWLHEIQMTSSQATPEHEAIRFYAAQQILAIAQSTIDPRRPLTEDQLDGLDATYQTINSVAARAMKYVLMITVREARHLKNCSSNVSHLLGEYDDDLGRFFREINGKSYDSAIARLKSSLKLKHVMFGDLVEAMVTLFDYGDWGSSYGGKKWADVTRPLANYVAGETNAIQFADTVWTLAHNGGPIFNKGYQYRQYDGHWLQKVLDVQRSGQIVEGVLDPANELNAMKLRKPVQNMMKLVPDWTPQGYVDWYAVEALGSIGSYGHLKAAQANTHGVPKTVAAKVKKAKKLEEANIALQNKHVYKVAHNLEIKKKESRDDE